MRQWPTPKFPGHRAEVPRRSRTKVSRLDKEEVENSRWLFYSTDGRTRESEARLQVGLPETQICSVPGNRLLGGDPREFVNSFATKMSSVWPDLEAEDGGKVFLPPKITKADRSPFSFLASSWSALSSQ